MAVAAEHFWFLCSCQICFLITTGTSDKLCLLLLFIKLDLERLLLLINLAVCFRKLLISFLGIVCPQLLWFGAEGVVAAAADFLIQFLTYTK